MSLYGLVRFVLEGEFIDEHLGLVLGLSTMASAAAGQVVSDFTGRSARRFFEEVVREDGR